MNKKGYWIVGTIRIPKDKKDELNKAVLELLYKGGIRKTETVELAGKEITVLKKPEPDEKGIVRFDYSIFEKRKRKLCSYNTNNCHLKCEEYWGNEFDIVIDMIMVLLEIFSSSQCYVMYGNELSNIGGYLGLIQSLTGKIYIDEKRTKLWDMVLFFRKHNMNIKTSEMCFKIPWDYSVIDVVQIRSSFFFDRDEIGTLEEKYIIHDKSEMTEENAVYHKYYIYEVIKDLYKKDRDKLEEYISELIKLNISKRKKLAKQDNEYADIATASLYALPVEIVKILSLVKKEDFWKVWDSLECKMYRDVIVENHKKNNESSEGKPTSFYKIISRKNEDEFIEFWDGENLVLSDEMKDRIDQWRDEFRNNKLVSKYNMKDKANNKIENYLASIITELYEEWNCRYVDEEFVKYVLENREDENLIKVLQLIKNLMDEDYDIFPELTKAQARSWFLKSYRNSHDRIAMSALQSLLINEKQRRNIFGF